MCFSPVMYYVCSMHAKYDFNYIKYVLLPMYMKIAFDFVISPIKIENKYFRKTNRFFLF